MPLSSLPKLMLQRPSWHSKERGKFRLPSTCTMVFGVNVHNSATVAGVGGSSLPHATRTAVKANNNAKIKRLFIMNHPAL
jgi:hypothetical protein